MMADFINWEIMLDKDKTYRHAGSHVSQLSNLFIDSHVIASECDDDYTGSDSVVYLFAPPNPDVEPKVVLVTDYFGSCGGCDVWEDIEDSDLKELLVAIANNARLFDSFEELDKFFSGIIDKLDGDGSYGEYYDLHGHVHSLRKQIRKSIGEI